MGNNCLLHLATSLSLFLSICSTAPGQSGPSAWTAKWIESSYQDTVSQPAMMFSKSFEVKKKVRSAVVYVTSHGIYEGAVNGKPISSDRLTPGWTSYNKRLQYQQYDVTQLLKKGDNNIEVTVGDGWYKGSLGYKGGKQIYGNTLGLLLQMEIVYTNGSKETLGTDGTWKTATGPIIFSDIYNGETIDARRDPVDHGVALVKNYGYTGLVPTENEPIRKHETFEPVKMITTPKGEKVIDFGQNLVGWVTVKASGAAGSVITIQHAEVLDKEGNFYTANLRKAKATATYILKGDKEEMFEPHFTFYGFRYIKVDGCPGELKPEDFTAVALYSDMKPAGTFECSNAMLNQLQHNIQWGQRGNFLDVPTDCPQRDERLGWTGDAQAFSRTASFNFNVEKFFSKWLKDVALDQRADGSVPHVVPDILGGNGSSAGWADVATIVPWDMYLVYGNKANLAGNYDMMKKWVGFMESKSVNDLWATGSHFGDWLSYRDPGDGGADAITDKYQIAQCFFAHSTQLVVNAARVLGKMDDVSRYEGLLAKVKAAFLREYVTPSGRLMSNTQTAYVLALQFDMLPENMRATAAKYLVDNIRRYKDHLTTGFLGTPYLCHVLSRFGYTDLAYTLLLQQTYPSWLYPITRGATTIWERWDGIKPDGTFQTPAMNSFNHYAYGAIGDWMYRVIAGIDTDLSAPGYKKIIVRPNPGGGLTWVKAGYDCVYGHIGVNWKMENGKFIMDVEIPAGTTADIFVPAGKEWKKHSVAAGVHHFES